MQRARDHGWHRLVRPDRLQSQLVPSSHHRRLGFGGKELQRNALQHRPLKSRPWHLRRNQVLLDLNQLLLHRGQWLGTVGNRDGFWSERRRLEVGGEGLQRNDLQHRSLKGRPWHLRRRQNLLDLIQLLLHRSERLGSVRNRDGLWSKQRRRQRPGQQLSSKTLPSFRPWIRPGQAIHPGGEGTPAGNPEEWKRHRGNLTHQVLRQSLRVHTVIYRVSQRVLRLLSDKSTPFIRPDDAPPRHG